MNLSMYPPQIKGKIPAFAVMTGEDTIITVPYELNKAVSLNDDFTHMCIMIKTVTTGTIKFTAETSECKLYNNILKSHYATFTIPASNLFQPTAGNYYKIQIAFKNNVTTEQSAWSNVSVIKCTHHPMISIDSLTPTIDNINPDIFIGSYINNDTTEKLYSYNFTIYDTDNNIYETSGNLIHNSSTDEVIAGVGVKSILRWQPTKSLKEDIRYRIALNITTINNYQNAAGPYTIRAASTVDARIPAKLLARPDYDNGCVHLSLVKLNSLTTEVPFSGRFVISRYDVQANLWREVCRFNMLSQTPSDIGEIWTDYTIEHGVKYLYALQAYNDNKLYSNRMIHVIPGINSYLEYDELGAPYYITSDFEDMFLTDGERQLRIRYNPKVSSYKTTILESKMETMGSKYPFIFRNGNVCYKEFPISGLLSYLTDEKELFMTGIHPEEDKFTRSHSAAITNPETYKEWMTTPGAGIKLTSENFYRERQFKTNVLDWLNNGKPKLFRSPGEGSYIVRLMNVSLSPNDTLGRMLHTFNAQAYEIAPCDFEHLKEFNLLSIPEIDNRVMKFRSVKLSEAMNIDLYSPGHEMYSIYITDASPGTKYTFSFAGLPASSSVTYTIGITGALSLDADVAPVASIVKNSGDIHNTAVLHYGYYDTSIPDNFSHITNITMSDAMAQIIGYDDTKNIITDKLQDIRKEVGTIYSIVIKPRHITKIYSRGGEYYRDSMFITEITQGWDETEIYFVVNETTFYSGNPHNKVILGHQMPKQYFKINNLYIIDLSTGNAFLSSDPMKNTLNTNPLAAKHFVQLTQGSYYVTGDFETIHSIHMSPGVYVELAYAQKEIEYSVESTEDDVKAAKAEWLAAQAAYIASSSAEDYAFMNAKYDIYVNLLEEAVANAQMEVQNYVL